MKIDKLLKGYARHRRESAGSQFELHAATRHLLQGEVARAYRGRRGGDPSVGRALAGFWRRLGLGGAVVACFALVLAVIYPVVFPKTDSRGVSLAKNEKPALPALRQLSETRPSQPRPVRPPASAAAPAVESLTDTAANGPVDVGANFKKKLPAVEALDRMETPVAAKETEMATALRAEAKAAEEPVLLANRNNRKLSARADAPTRRTTRGVGSGGGMLAPPPAQNEAMAADLSAAATVTNTLTASSISQKPLAAGRMQSTVALGLAASPASKDKSGFAFYFNNQAALVQNREAKPPGKETLTESRSRQKSASAPSMVLNSFLLRQQGDNITITDDDGSVYKGQIMDTATAERTLLSDSPTATRYGASVASPSNPSAPQQMGGKFPNTVQNMGQQIQNALSFQASGSNRLLNQSVAIQGRILADNNSLAANSLQLNTQNAASGGSSTNAFFGLFNNSTAPIRIQGQVIIGRTNRQEIDAIQQISH